MQTFNFLIWVKRLSNFCFTLAVFLAVFIFPRQAHAQAKLTTLKGRITDPNGKSIEKASFSLLNTNFSGLTDERGVFTISGIPRGDYRIEVSAVGYAASTVLVHVTSNNEQSVEIKLFSAATQLGTVVVTAQKKQELMQSAAISMSAFNSKQVQEYRLWNIKDLSAVAPNLYMGNPGDGRNVASIRGVTTTSYDPAVATYVDGVNQFNLDTYIGQLLDIERIEVLRGPQGSLYGRNAMGGVINIITKQPSNNTTGFAEVNIGNYGAQRYIASIKTPLKKDKLYFGATLVYEKRKGFYKNSFTGGEYENQQSLMGNYYLKYLPGRNWSITLNAKHVANRNNGAFPLVFGIDQAFAKPYQLSQNTTAKMIDNVNNFSLSLNHSGGDFIFSSHTAYQSNHRYYNAPLDGDFSPLDAITIINDYGNKWNHVKALTQEFRFSSPTVKTSALKWTAGAYLFLQDNPVKQATHYGKDAAMLGAPDIDFSTMITSKGKSNGGALYGQGTYSIMLKLDLTVGVRYDYEKKKYSVLGEYQKDPSTTPVFITQPDTSASVNFSALSPTVGFSYKISEKNLLFITYARGFRTGGLTQLGADPSQPPLYPYKPEYSNNLTLGVKNDLFKQRLRINVSAFLGSITDVQVPTLVLPDAITVTRNTGKLNTKGIEMEISSTPVRGLQVDYNLGYTHARYKTLKVSGSGSEKDLSGKSQVFTPDITSMLAAQYSANINLPFQLKPTARIEWLYTGKQYFDFANTISQGSYHLLNFRAGLENKKVSCYFWMRNAGRKEYVSFAYDFGAVHLGDPKTYGITLALHW